MQRACRTVCFAHCLGFTFMFCMYTDVSSASQTPVCIWISWDGDKMQFSVGRVQVEPEILHSEKLPNDVSGAGPWTRLTRS